MVDIATVGIGVDTRGLEKGEAGLKKLGRTGDKVEKDLGRGTNRLSAEFMGLSKAVNVAAGALAGIGLIGISRQILDVNRETQKLKASLQTVTGSIENANVAWAKLEEFASTTPFSLQQSVNGFVKMKALGLDPTEKALQSFGNTAAAMGKDLNQMIEAVADASTSEFERLKEFGIKAKQEGDRVSLTFQGVTTEIGNNAQDIVGYLETIGNTQFAGAMARQMDTLNGQISNLSDSTDRLFRSLGESGFNQAAAAAISGLSDAVVGLDENLDTVAQGATIAAGIFAGRLVSSMATATAASVTKTAASLAEAKATAANSASEIARLKSLQAVLPSQIAANLGTQRATALRAKLAQVNTALSATEATYAAALTRTTIAARSATVAAAGLKSAMAFVGGPLGIAVVAAAGVFAFREELGLFARSVDDVDAKIGKLRDGFKGLSEAQLESQLVSMRLKMFELEDAAHTASAAMNAELADESFFERANPLNITNNVNAINRATEATNALNAQQQRVAEVMKMIKELRNNDGSRDEQDNIDKTTQSLKDQLPILREQLELMRQGMSAADASFAAQFNAANALEREQLLLKNAIERATDAQEEQADAAEAAAKAIEDEYLAAAKKVEDAWDAAGNIIYQTMYDVFDRSLDSFEDFADAMLDGFKQMLARMVAEAATTEILISIGAKGSVTDGKLSFSDLSDIVSAGQFLADPLGSTIGSSAFVSASSALGFGSQTSAALGASQAGYTGSAYSSWAAGGSAAGTSMASSLMTGLSTVGFYAAIAAAGFEFGKSATSAIEGEADRYDWANIIFPGLGSIIEDVSSRFSSGWSTRNFGLRVGEEGLGEADFFNYQKRKKNFKTRRRTIISDVDAALDERLDMMLDSSLGIVVDAFGVFGVDAATAIDGAMAEVARDISFKGGEKAVAERIGAYLRDLNQAVVDQLDISGIENVDQLVAVSNQYAGINQTLSLLGANLLEVSEKGLEASMAIVGLAGGIENFQQASATFFNTFASESQKWEATQTQVNRLFDDLNLSLPATASGLFDLVQGLDLNTESGQQAYIAITSATSLMNDYYSTQERSAKQLAEAANISAQEVTEFTNAVAAAMGVAGFDGENVNRRDATFWALQQLGGTVGGGVVGSTALSSAIAQGAPLQELIKWMGVLLDPARVSEIADSVADITDAYEDQAKTIADSVAELDSLSAAIVEFASGTVSAVDTPMQSLARLRNEFASTIDAAMGGDRAAMGAIPSAGGSLVDAIVNNAATAFDAAVQVAVVRGQAQGVLGSIAGQKTEAERQLELLQEQLGGIVDVKDATLSVAEQIEMLRKSFESDLFGLASESGLTRDTGVSASISPSAALIDARRRAGLPLDPNKDIREELQQQRDEMRIGMAAIAQNTKDTAKKLDRFDDDDALAVRVLT